MPDYCIDPESTPTTPTSASCTATNACRSGSPKGRRLYSGLVTTNVSGDRVPIPDQLSDLTAGWFSQVLDCHVSAVEVIDAHSGTTGRARVRLTTGGAVPETLFVKLQPFTQEQRGLIRQVGLGVAEARVYANIGSELPVRVPRVWHSAYQPADGAFVMVLEDLTATGCRFPATGDEDMLDVAHSTVEELAKLHAAYRDRKLPWLRTAEGMRAKPDDPNVAARRSMFIKIALDKFGVEMPSVFRRLAELYIERTVDVVTLFGQGEHTLIHGDSHIGNLFVDNGRTGFYDWAVASRGPGIRDLAYFMCNSVPTDLRRAHQDDLFSRYRRAFELHGCTVDDATAHEQYRLFSVYAWIAATSTAAMGSKWQPIEIARPAMIRATESVEDLDAVGLLEEQLGRR
jgi:aminoglycoside phosphotransferase (APT) family kinase protein